MIKVTLEFLFEKQEGFTTDDYRDMVFDEIYHSDFKIDSSQCKVEDTEKDFLR